MGGFFQIRVLVTDGLKLLQAAHVLANGDVFHLGGDNALIGIPFLSDGVAGGFERLALEAGVFLELVFGGFVLVVFLRVGVGEIAIIRCGDLAAIVFLDVIAVENPLAAHGRESLTNITFEIRITPWAGAVIDANGGVLLDSSILVLGIGESDLTHGDFDAVVYFTLHINPGGVGELGRVFLNGGEFFGVVDVLDEVAGIVGTLVGVVRCDVVFVGRDHGGILNFEC